MKIENNIIEDILETDGYEPEADLPEPQPLVEAEPSQKEYERQKIKLAQEWPKLTGVEMPNDIKINELSDDELIKTLYENLIKGTDLAIEQIGFEIDNELLNQISQTTDKQKKAELEKEFIDSILKQTRSKAEGGKFNRGKEDTWSFYPKQISQARRLNCSGATLLVGRILEKSGFQVDHGIAANHAVSVVNLSDGKKYYVDSRRNRHNIVALEDEAKPIGDFYYHELRQPLVAYEKIIVIPRERADIDVIIGNYNMMRRETKQIESQDAEARRQISELDKYLGDIDFGWLWSKFFPESNKLYMENAEWQAEEKRVAVKHDFGDRLEKEITEQMGGLGSEQKIALTNELQKNGQAILEFCSNLNADSINLKNVLSPDAYRAAVIIRDALESIRGQSQEGYEFALAELKAKILTELV